MISRINPISFLPFLLVLLVLFIYLSYTAQNELKQENRDFQEFKVMAEDYKNIQNFFYNKKDTQKALEKHIKSASFKSVNITNQKSSFIIEINNASIDAIDKFFNKILNDKIIVQSFQIEPTKATLIAGFKK
jgi:septal ring factor EnvC (AmiA/AmiB activator)